MAAAKAELAPLSAADRAVYDQAVAAWQGLPGAEAALQQLAERHPLDPVAVAWCQLVAIRHDEQDLVARYGTWLWLANPRGGTSVARVVLGQPLPQPGRRRGPLRIALPAAGAGRAGHRHPAADHLPGSLLRSHRDGEAG